VIRVGLFLLLLTGCNLLTWADSPPFSPAVLALYDTTLNQQAVGINRFLRTAEGAIYLHETELAKLHLRVPQTPPLQEDGQRWYALSSLAGCQAREDVVSQSIVITLAPEAFLSTAIQDDAGHKKLQPTLPNWGAYSNYELLTGQAASSQQLVAGLNMQVFGPIGNFSNSVIQQNLRTPTTQSSQLIRQETRWSRDWPEQMLNTQLGDSQVASSLWGRSAHFGGVHLGSQFATQPEFSTSAMPLLGGVAALPSTVELYVDGQLRNTFEVPIGPFQLNDFPPLAGQGEAKIIIRDGLGREQQVIAPYASTPLLLKAGVSDYQVNAGLLRRNFGQATNDYGRAMSSATVRRGWSEILTLEGRAELISNQTSLGAGASYLTQYGVASSALAVSSSASGAGALKLIALDSPNKTGLSYTLKGQFADTRFVQLQEELNLTPLNALQPQFVNAALTQLQAIRAITNPQRLLTANLGWRFSSGSYVSASYTERSALNQAANKIAALNYSTQLGGGLSFNAMLFSILGATASQSMLFTLSMPFGKQGGIATLSAAQQNQQLQPILQVQQSPAPNWGYHALAVGGLNQRQEAGLALQTETGAYNLALGRSTIGGNYRAEARGALAWIDGEIYNTRTIHDSFALVHVPGYANLPVLGNQRVMAHTNTNGDALLPELQSYHDNQIAIDPLTLPLDAHSIESSLTMIPYQHSGLIKTLTIKRNRSALLTLQLDDGSPAPIGMDVSLTGSSEKFMVGMRGEVYVTELATNNQFSATWQGKTCHFDYAPPPDANEMSYSDAILCSLRNN
jgi:outer membrane usher protein